MLPKPTPFRWISDTLSSRCERRSRSIRRISSAGMVTTSRPRVCPRLQNGAHSTSLPSSSPGSIALSPAESRRFASGLPLYETKSSPIHETAGTTDRRSPLFLNLGPFGGRRLAGLPTALPSRGQRSDRAGLRRDLPLLPPTPPAYTSGHSDGGSIASGRRLRNGIAPERVQAVDRRSMSAVCVVATWPVMRCRLAPH